jgi:hypothetical protein
MDGSRPLAPASARPGSTFGGAGSFASIVTLAGTVAPGDPSLNGGVGTLSLLSDLAMRSGSALAYDLGTKADSDLTRVGGALTRSGSLDITALSGFGAGTYDPINDGSFAGGSPAIGTAPARISHPIVKRNDQADQIVTPRSLPEPSAVVLLATALAAHQRHRAIVRRLGVGSGANPLA